MIENALQEQLKKLEWMIPDAQRRVAKAAQAMARRAQEAVSDSEALLAGQPCSLSWIDFAEGDLREAREAKAELMKLVEQQRLLTFIAKQGA